MLELSLLSWIYKDLEWDLRFFTIRFLNILSVVKLANRRSEFISGDNFFLWHPVIKTVRMM